MSETLTFLKRQLADVEAQLAPLNRLCAILHREIAGIETTELLAAHGLALGDALASTSEFAVYNHLTGYDRLAASGVLYVTGVNFEQVVVQKYANGGGVAYGASFEMALRMKAAAR